MSRRLQQQLLSPPPGGSTLCWAMREAILGLCRDNVIYGGQIEVDGIICITGPQDGQQLVVKVHELLDNERRVGKQTQQEKKGSADAERENSTGRTPESPDKEPSSDDSPAKNDRHSSPQNYGKEDQEKPSGTEQNNNNSLAVSGGREEDEDEEDDDEPSMSDHYGSEGLVESGRTGEVEALDLRLDSPASRIKQEPMDYEESFRYHPYGSSMYRQGTTQDANQADGSSSSHATVDRHIHSAAEGGSSSIRGNSPPTTPHPPLIVPFLGPAPHHDMSEASFPGPGASPFMDSRLRHLLSKMPYAKPHHPGMQFLPRRPLFPTISALHSSAPECKACGFTFAQVELLKEHNEAVHAVFTCSVCYRTFTSRSNLDRHSRLHTGHKPYICVKCGKAFSRKDHLTNHSAKHAFKCGKCLKRFVERQALQGHYEQDHQVSLTNICEHCNKGFSDQAVFAEHLKSHPEYLGGTKIHPKHKPFACNECNYVCADKLQLLKHNQLHGESGKTLSYTCMSCGETFHDPLAYSQHFDGHQELTDIFECCICRKVCHTWRELKQHEQSHLHHSSRGPTLACPVCYIIFDNEEVLAEHIQQHDTVGLGTFPCNVCNEAFPSLEGLQRHEQEEKHYVKKAFTSPHHPPTSPRPGSPQDSAASPRPASADRAFLSSVCDSESNDSDEELDVLAVDESPRSAAANGGKPDQDKKGHFVKDFVITENPTSVIEVSGSDADVDIKPTVTDAFASGSSSASVASPSASSSMAVTAPIPTPLPTAPVFPERSPHHLPPGISPPLTSLSSIMAAHSPQGQQPSPDPTPSSSSCSTPWLPHPFHNHNNTGYAFPTPITEYTCAMCDGKLLSFHDYETHCFSDHFRYPCMYCTKTFAQKANRDRHVCIHTGEKPYPCPECDQKFARGDKLKIHRMKWHNIQFPSTYSRPKENTSPSLELSARRKDNNSDWMHQESNSASAWPDHESLDQEMMEERTTTAATLAEMKGEAPCSAATDNPE